MRVKDVEGYQHGLAWLQHCSEQLNKLRDEGYNTYHIAMKLNSIIMALAGVGEAELSLMRQNGKEEEKEERKKQKEEQRKEDARQKEEQRRENARQREQERKEQKRQKEEQQRENARLTALVAPSHVSSIMREAITNNWVWKNVVEYLEENNVHDEYVYDVYKEYWQSYVDR
jgi:hypothetical protein